MGRESEGPARNSTQVKYCAKRVLVLWSWFDQFVLHWTCQPATPTTVNQLRLIDSYFDDYQELVWFVLILLSSTHNTGWFLIKTMGTNCPNIQDIWATATATATSFWVEFGKTAHVWLKIGGRLYPWRASDLTQIGYSLAGQVCLTLCLGSWL